MKSRAAVVVGFAYALCACATGGNVAEQSDGSSEVGRGGGVVFETDPLGEDAPIDGLVETLVDSTVDANAAVDADADADAPILPSADAPIDTYVEETPSVCSPMCTTCGADDGCGSPCVTGTCGAGSCVAGICVEPTNSYISPADSYTPPSFPRALDWTLASEAPATIVYTLDGSEPQSTSPKGPSPLLLTAAQTPSGTTIRWYADDGVVESTTHSFTVSIDTSMQSYYGWVVDQVDLGSGSPVLVASPGASISGTAAWQSWVSTGCPDCAMQLIYGVGDESTGCFYDNSPSTYPGVSGSGSFTVTAPTAPGTYELNITYTLQYTCADGLATNPMGVRPTNTIGIIVVK